MAIADELIALLGYEMRGEDVARRYEATLNRITNTLGRAALAAGRFAAVAAGALTTGLMFFGRSVIETNAQFESFQATLETIEGSADKARAALDWIAEFGKQTPYDVAQVTAAFVKLKAYGIDPIANDTLRTLGDTASAMGKTLNDAVEAFADASTGEFERLKEFGIKAKTQGDQVTFSWTKNGEELTRTVKKSATDIRAFLLETMGDRFTGAMEKQSKTWRGMVSNLGDTWTDFQRRVGEAGFFDNVRKRLEGLLETLARLDREGKIDLWAERLSTALSAMADVLWFVGERVASVVGFLVDNFDKLKGPLIAVGLAFGALLVWAFPVLSTFAAIGLAVDDFISYLQGGESVIGSMIEWLKGLPAAVSEAAAAFTSWLSNVDWSAAGNEAGRMLVDALVAGVAGTLSLLWALFVDAPATIAGFLMDVDWAQIGAVWLSGVRAQLDFVVGLFTGIGTRVSEKIKEWFNIDFAAIGEKIGRGILAGLQLIGQQIRDWIMSLVPPGLLEFIQGGPAVGSAVPVLRSEGQAGPSSSSGTPDLSLSTDLLDYKLQLNQEETRRALGNLNDNLQKMSGDAPAAATITDARQDNRQFPFTSNVTVNQTVTSPAAAPAAAAQATGSAVSQSVAKSRGQVESEPAF